MHQKIEILPIEPSLTLELRHTVLRPHQSREECVYPGDESPSSFHLGAYVNGQLQGVLSCFQEASTEHQPAEVAALACMRIRGVAVAPSAQGMGLGRKLMDGCLREAPNLSLIHI